MKKPFEFRDANGKIFKEGDYVRYLEPIDIMWNGIARCVKQPIGKVVKLTGNKRPCMCIHTIEKGISSDIVDVLKKREYWSEESIAFDPYYRKIGRENEFSMSQSFSKKLEIFDYNNESNNKKVK